MVAMTTVTEPLACGTVQEVRPGSIVLRPAGTNYALHLACTHALSAGAFVRGRIRLQARKIWTVPSGGNFVAPIMGPPRIVQGRVRQLDQKQMVLQAGTSVIVDLPGSDEAYDLANGPVAVGALVNVTAMPGASFEPADSRPVSQAN